MSGKYADGASGRLRHELRDPRRSAALQLGAALRRPAAALGTTPATLAIAFTLLHPRTAATLIGATTPAQIDAAIDAVQLAGRLTAGDVAELRGLAESRLSAGALSPAAASSPATRPRRSGGSHLGPFDKKSLNFERKVVTVFSGRFLDGSPGQLRSAVVESLGPDVADQRDADRPGGRDGHVAGRPGRRRAGRARSR